MWGVFAWEGMKMSLQIWAVNGWLRAHRTSRQEIGELLKIVEAGSAKCRKDDAAGISNVMIPAFFAVT